MMYPLRKSGSSLLIILLIMVAVGSVVLAGSRVLINSSRTGNQVDSATLALRMARSGIEDGLLLHRQNFLTQGEYGQIASSPNEYTLNPQRRGFRPNTNCTELAKDQPAQNTAVEYDRDCPYYDFAIRTIVAYPGNQAGAYSLTSRELPYNTEVFIPIKRNPGINWSFNSLDDLSYDFTICADFACTNIIVSGSGQNNPLLVIPSQAAAMKLTVRYTLPGSNHVTVVQSATAITGSDQIAIGKGYTTVDVTGYAGTVKKKLILTIRKNDRLTPNSTLVPMSFNLLDFAQTFNQYGILQP